MEQQSTRKNIRTDTGTIFTSRLDVTSLYENLNIYIYIYIYIFTAVLNVHISSQIEY